MLSNTVWVLAAVVVAASFASAFSQTVPPPPPFPRDVPPGFEKVLPPNVLAELRKVHRDDSLSWEHKHEKINAIMSALPAEILDKLPLPPGFDKLPKDVLNKIRAIHRDTKLSWRIKHQKIHSIIEALPEEIKNQLPPPPPPPGFEKLPKDVQDKLRSVHEDKSLTWSQRHKKIHSIIMALPEELRSLLPPPPPWVHEEKTHKQNNDQ
uniref:SXP/RAL-2 family protein Ani s 5-like cation-binding domain-containing protein n=1 Tax=Syphacia muris TaxID=451379 RepID=A0A0N5AXF2_9BILA